MNKGGNYPRFDAAKMLAYNAEADQLKRVVAVWEASFHVANVVAIKNKKLAAVDAWRKSRLASDTPILNGEEEAVRRQRREELGKAVDMNFREILKDVFPRLAGRSMPIARSGLPDWRQPRRRPPHLHKPTPSVENYDYSPYLLRAPPLPAPLVVRPTAIYRLLYPTVPRRTTRRDTGCRSSPKGQQVAGWAHGLR